MKTLEADVQASRNRLRGHQEKFANLSEEIKVTHTCEIARLMRKVSLGHCFRRVHDIDERIGGKTR